MADNVFRTLPNDLFLIYHVYCTNLSLSLSLSLFTYPSIHSSFSIRFLFPLFFFLRVYGYQNDGEDKTPKKPKKN
ncbi:hypothetical protein GGR50DRAFT_495351 [Xylaria sp. CBS 124048]|nr:hypothetical protein GGR50DRAFT_495351 [Xylaria sp. CBS 124048]